MNECVLALPEKLPDGAKFLGYVVHLSEANEFLSESNEIGSMTVRTFSRNPGKALLFSEPTPAGQVAARCKQRAVVALLFDAGEKFAVVHHE